jgi:hypothetical protein
MPAPHGDEVRRGRLLHGMFWSGVGLAPLAILILLFGQGMGALRIAVVVAALAIVMLAVSIAMRPSVELLRADIEERVLNEVDHVRLRAREEISTAARNTHRVLTEKIQQLTQTVEMLRSEVEELRESAATSDGPQVQVAAPASAGPGVVRRTETVHVTRRTTTVDAGDDEGRGTVYGSRAAIDGQFRERPDRPERSERRDGRDDRDDRYDEPRSRRDDRHDDDPRPARRDRPESWDAAWESAGDRWASVRSDDQGRELRVGERRSSVRRGDGGTEFRVEDRWAALRRDDPDDRDDRYGESDWEETFRSLSRRPRSPAALPPARGDSPDRYTDEPGRSSDERERVRSRGRDRDYERDRDRDRGYDRDRERDRDRDYERDRDRDYDRGRDYDREREYDRERRVPRPRSPHPYDR